MRRAGVAVFFAAVLGMAVLAGCSDDNSSSQDDIASTTSASLQQPSPAPESSATATVAFW
jgi:outer membrane murein-binding lipoprotein Lpp